MVIKRTDRLNSLLKEVLSEVIRENVKNPNLHELSTVTQVDISRDLHNAKVYISVIGTEKEKQETLSALKSAAGFIAVVASKKVVMRYFPQLTFYIDDTIEKQIKINDLLQKIKLENPPTPAEDDS
ncbi:MAG: Ribosome-binding factor A [Chlamydiae bacterium]|nr:Ribosome-binding factor A [Chlamydiota bacterium]